MNLLIEYTSPKVPSDILLLVFSYLDVNSVSSCLQVCRNFLHTIEGKFWKIIFFRDFAHFLYQMPLSEEELNPPQREQEIQMLRKQSSDLPTGNINDHFENQIGHIQEQILQEASQTLTNWKSLYILCHMRIDLNGYWVGDYGRHGKELIHITQKGYEVIARKITGDENVPAGQIAWRMKLNRNLMKGKGFMQVAEIGHKNATWVTSYLDIIDQNSLQITWFIYDHLGNWYSLTFGTVRVGTSYFDTRVLERKVEMLGFSEDALNMFHI